MIGICKYSKQCIFWAKALYFEAVLFIRQLTCLPDYDLKDCIKTGNSKITTSGSTPRLDALRCLTESRSVGPKIDGIYQDN